MADAIPGVSGRIIDCGRETTGENQVTVYCGQGQHITIRGLSDTVTKKFAENLYRAIMIEFEVRDDG